MKEMNNIDDLFRKETERHYPVDELLWAAVESQLPINDRPKTPWVYSLNTIVLLAVLLTCSFIPKDNSRTTKSAPVTLHTNSPKTTINQTYETKENVSTVNNKSRTSSIIESEPKQPKESNPTIATERYETEHQVDKSSSTTIRRQTQTFGSATNKLNSFNSKSSSIRIENKKFTSTKHLEVDRVLISIPLLTDFVELDPKVLTVKPITSKKLNKYPSTKSYYNVEFEALFSVALSKSLNNGEQGLMNTKRDGETSIEFKSLALNFIGQKKFLIYGIGIQQSQYSERFAYNIDVEKSRLVSSYDTNYRVINGNYNSNGTPVLLIEQEITENQNTEEFISKDVVGGLNTFKWIGLPLFIGVQKSFQNWQAQARCSIIPQYSYHQSGYYVGNDLNSLNALSEQNVNTFHFSNRNDLSLGYSFHEQFAIGAKYSMLRDLNSFTKEYDSQLKSQLIGVWIMWKP
tara:strand:+ start:6784 stop:8163 length:1380 start_codon:yes stop_codon:yes gene_type:complete